MTLKEKLLAQYDAEYKAVMGDNANMAQVYEDNFPNFSTWLEAQLRPPFCGHCGDFHNTESPCP